MVNKKGLIIALLVIAVILSIFSLTMTLNSENFSGIFEKGSTEDSLRGNVQLSVIPSSEEQRLAGIS